MTPLRRGLESRSVVLVRARPVSPSRRPVEFVVKHLGGELVREAVVYRHVASGPAAAVAPALLAVERLPDRSVLLYLEAVRSTSAWPWREFEATRAVVETLAGLHASLAEQDLPRGAVWDYEGLLMARARHALELLEEAPRCYLPETMLRTRPALRRLVLGLERIRANLLGFGPPAPGLVHGDVHSANVVFMQRSRPRVVLLDWARVRCTSPLEDVSSWLQSLGLWEPEARRRHDSLLAAYLSGRGERARLGDDLRGAYWLAGASNVLAGAFAHHLAVALEQTRAGRAASQIAAAWLPVHGWARVLRRADAFFS